MEKAGKKHDFSNHANFTENVVTEDAAIYLIKLAAYTEFTLPRLLMENLFISTLALFFFFVVTTCFSYSACAGSISFTFPPCKDDITLYENLDAYFQGTAIQLTKNQATGTLQTSFGWATYKKSVPIWDKSSQALANFSTHFQFVISKVSNNSYAGDGMTFFMAPVHFEPPVNATGEWLGLFNQTTDGSSSNHIVAVEFDTFKNFYMHGTRKIYFDPDGNHVGIDVNGRISKLSVSLSKIASDPFKNEILNNGKCWDAWVDYNGGIKQLQVFLFLNPSCNTNNISKPGRPIFSYPLDLSKFLPEKIKVGMSGSTGNATETHTVYAWNFSSEYWWDKSTASKETYILKVILIALLACFLVVCGVMFVGKRHYFKVRESQDADQEREENLDEYISQGPHKFSYAELSVATRNFSDDEKLGEGGFGAVYKGILPATNEVVAVKKISETSKQGKKEYISEVTIISKLRHRNLVQLLGWCHENGELLLVYEFLPNGSLDQYIFAKRKGYLDWDGRYSIACDIASALVYLHEDCDQRVVHRDVKASNVMLDSAFIAKLGDFGLARVVERDQDTSQTTVVAGTLGYIAPECVITGKASLESDVFSFGAVSLEIACGVLSVDRNLTHHNCRLVEWVWDLYGRGKLFDAVDKRLVGNFNGEEMQRLMSVGLLCSHPNPKARPTMRKVLKILKMDTPLPFVPMNFPVAVYSDSLSLEVGSSSNDAHRFSYSLSLGSSSKGKMSSLLISGPVPRT